MMINTVNAFKLFFVMVLLSACSTPEQEIELEFVLSANNKPLTCLKKFNINEYGRSFSVLDFRFYLSNIQLTNTKGEKVPITLQQDNNPWQYQNIALIDLAGNDSECNGKQTRNTKIIGKIPKDEYHNLEFTIGVPFNLNHNEPAFTQSPLNIGSMFWSWQMGYKFLRVDLIDDHNLTWFFHLGSTNCASPSKVKAPASCDKPNRVTIHLKEFNFNKQRIQINLEKLLENAMLTPSSKCMSHTANNNDCQILFSNLSLDSKTGLCIDECKQQKVFTHEE